MNADSSPSGNTPEGTLPSGASPVGAPSLESVPSGAPAAPRPASLSEIVLGMLLFVVLGVGAVLFTLPPPPGGPSIPLDSAYAIAGLTFFIGWLLIMAALAYAWLRGFPRWSMPYLFFGVIFSMYLFAAATPGFVVFGIPMWGTQPWGLRACVPLFVVILVGFWFSRPRGEPLYQLWDHIWRDWTYLSFGLFAFLPLLLPIIMDEMDHAYTLWPTIAGVACMILFAALYLIFAHKPYRAAFLLAGMFLAVLATSIGSNYYWKTHAIDIETNIRTPLPGPAPWAAIIIGSLVPAAIWTFILALPALIGLMRYMVTWGGRKAQG